MNELVRRTPRINVFNDPHQHLNVIRFPNHGSANTQHAHTFDELVVIVGGHGKHGVGEGVYEIQTGDVFVILGDTTHGYPEVDHLSLINILYEPDHLGIPRSDLGSLPGYHALFTIEPQIRQQQNFRNRLRLDVDQLTRATQIIAEIEEELAAKERGHRFMATSHLMRLIGYLSRCYSRLELDEKRPVTQISEVLGYIDRHFAEPLTVQDLMRVAHMSQTSLMRAFKEVLGRSPVDYLIRLRIARARHLIRRTDLPITDIAYEVGFTDSNYFSRQFRRVTGQAPREYRRQLPR